MLQGPKLVENLQLIYNDTTYSAKLGYDKYVITHSKTFHNKKDTTYSVSINLLNNCSLFLYFLSLNVETNNICVLSNISLKFLYSNSIV